MRHAARHLADCGQSFGHLLTPLVFGLVGIFDKGQIEIEQHVQGTAGLKQFGRVADQFFRPTISSKPRRRRERAALV